jgi:hypothetical protein
MKINAYAGTVPLHAAYLAAIWIYEKDAAKNLSSFF